ncbi:hypothetical protein AURDEDRAFT_161469 [Auricularia subglabra TFB-10046 SS5]|nr:hypothetical protein AURDEDRAFT_161469 [Auricularia subglabra TFB-10046 SS5]
MFPIAHDDVALRQLLESDFHRLSRDVTSAQEISAIVAHLLTATQRIVHDLASSWNKRSAIYRLPDELIAASCALLPLRDRLSASHVSRSWRHAALGFPSVWCDIEISSRCWNPAAIIEMMLSRTGQLPVSFSYNDDLRAPEGYQEIMQAIGIHMHHMASISWRSDSTAARNLEFTQPAPLLRSLVTNVYCSLPESFLGGQRGSLRTLHVPLLRLPASCAAFSTVTDLRGSAPEFMDDTETLRNLFTLFPRLETLWLSSLRDPMAHHMPAGPAPLSLTHLRLSTFSEVCDHAARYLAWKTPALVHTELIYQAPIPEIATTALCALFVDAVEMSVQLPNEIGSGAEIALRDAAGATCRLRFAYPARDAAGQFAALLHTVELARVRRLSADIGVFSLIVQRLPPGLQHVTLHAHAIDLGREFPRALQPLATYPWTSLDSLGLLAARCPSLASLTLEVHPLDRTNPPSAQTARDLLKMMPNLGTKGLPDVHIRGFSGDVVRELDGEPNKSAPAVKLVFDL